MLEKLKGFAKNDTDSAELAFKKLLILLIALTCCLCGVCWSGLYLVVFGAGLIAFLPFLFVIIVGSAIVISHFLYNYKILVYAQILCIMWVTAFIQWSIGSIDQSGYVTAWSLVGPIVALIFLSFRESIIWMLMFIVIIVISVVVKPSIPGIHVQTSEQTKALFYLMNIGMASSVVFAASAWFATTMKNEKSISDNLLLNILPEDVAQELKVNGKVEPRHFENVTVLFTDFKDFTKTSGTLTSKELVAEINQCFSAFDNIITRHNIEKIKTIGDAYMAVCGLPMADPKHAENVVNAAKEIAHFMAARYTEMGNQTFQIRMGIHSGSVVAGIVGVKKFAYDIWGDTVNIAARMEQNSEAGKINISQITYELVKNTFTCEYRGEVHAKGKGMLKMYFVESANLSGVV